MSDSRGPDAAAVPLLRVEALRVAFHTSEGVVQAVDGVAFQIQEGEILGVVGESGSGKSVTSMSILGLVPTPPATVEGTIAYRGEDLLAASPQRMRQVRGNEIAMIFQDPMTALNPVMRVGKQIAEAIRLHNKVGKAAAFARAVELLALMGVPQPEERARQYPHEFSGGMRQRAVIAMAMANNPRLLIADEPTTALDVTIQAQVLDVLRTAQRETGAATIFITHDLGVVAELADRIVVMYGGRVMEEGVVRDVFERPSHPYTRRLLESLPSLTDDAQQLVAIPGEPPNLLIPEPGCPFRARCSVGRNREVCATERPALVELAPGHRSACHFARELDELDIPLSVQAAGGKEPTDV